MSEWDMAIFASQKADSGLRRTRGSLETSEDGLLSRGETWFVGMGAVAMKRFQRSS